MFRSYINRIIQLELRTSSFAGPHSGLEPLRGLWRGGLVLVMLAAACSTNAVSTASALGVLGRLQITYFNLWFVFLFFAHITFLIVVFYGYGLCQSRRIGAARRRPSYREEDHPAGSACLSNASAAELRPPRDLRPRFPSTNSRCGYYHYPCHSDVTGFFTRLS